MDEKPFSPILVTKRDNLYIDIQEKGKKRDIYNIGRILQDFLHIFQRKCLIPKYENEFKKKKTIIMKIINKSN